jgi:hypothetical protein
MADAMLDRVYKEKSIDWAGVYDLQKMGERRTTYIVALSRSADMRLSCINDELLNHFDLSPCVSPGPPRTLASPLRPIALAPVRLDHF